MWIVHLEKKIFKWFCILLGVIILLIGAVHIYIVNNAEHLIEDLVRDKSNNKLRLKLEKIRFNYFSNKVVLENAAFYSNDSPEPGSTYSFKIKKINLRVKSLLAIFTKKELNIDSLFLDSPDITVMKLKTIHDTISQPVSVSEEMGRVYNSIMKALTFLKLKRFELAKGQFTLIDKTDPALDTLHITNLNFHFDNFRADTSQHTFFGTDQMVFKTHDQNITFPDRKHRLAFSRFRINIRKKLIEIDSCTLTGRKPGTDRARFSIFLDTVKLINVDFNTLYHQQIIKADSLYCRNPDLKIDIQLRNQQSGKKSLPNLDTVIQQLTGDVILNYIGVNNATITINAYRGDNPTNFSSDKNNFEMLGLVIDHNKPQPVTLSGFSMALHNYRTYLKDSSYFLRFDSIQLRENRILLANFSINTEPYKDTRNIRVKQFALSGISWSDLLFDKKIVAAQATLFTPVIDYVQPATIRKRNKPFLSSLQGINNVMSLERIKVVDGEVKIQLRNRVSLSLQNTDFSINSEHIDLTSSAAHAEQSVDSLSFNKGVIKVKDITIDMNNAKYNGDKNNLSAERINIYNSSQSFNILAKELRCINSIFNDTLSSISADAVTWKEARIQLNNLKDKKEKAKSGVILNLANIHGTNTQIEANISNGSTSVFLDDLFAKKIVYAKELSIDGFNTRGKDLDYSTPESELSAMDFIIRDHSSSVFKNLNFKQTKGSNIIDIKTPELIFIPDLQSIINGNTSLENVKLNNPEIIVQVNEKKDAEKKTALPNLKISTAEINNPVFKMENSVSAGLRSMSWNGDSTTVLLEKIETNKEMNKITIGSFNSSFRNFSFTDSKNKNFNSNEGSFKADLRDLIIQPGQKLYWKALVKQLEGKNFSLESSGQKPFTIKINEGTINDLSLGSAFGKLNELIPKNFAYSIQSLSGSAVNEKTKLKWQNISYTRADKNLSLDSFSVIPVLSRDEFIAIHPFQTDYITFKSGKINMSGLDVDHYFTDSSLRIHTIDVIDPYFTSYRDKRPPFNQGVFKPLPSKLIQRIPFKVSVDTVRIYNGTVVYTELNDKTKETGVIPVTRMSGDILPIKNFGITAADTLRIRLNGYLLDSAWVRLRTRESYADPLSGFQITVRMRPRSLLYLNSMLASLGAVKIQSGYLDTLTMRAIANDVYAFGEMRMFYRGLKVQFFASGNESKKNFITGLKTFIANSFIIRNKNTKRTGVVYFPRLIDRSFINYYIKTFTSGIASAIGAKNTRKMLKRYQKEIKQRNLPAIDSD
jgi:hypothetical protein